MQFAPLRQWNSLIQSTVRDSYFLEALNIYSSLLKSGVHGDYLTFPFVLKACARLGLLLVGREVHCHVIGLGVQSDVFVQTSLLDMYSKCSSLTEARQLFDQMPVKTVVSWNSIIHAYAKEFNTMESIRIFNEMHSRDVTPTLSTCVGLVSGCSGSALDLRRGQSVHCYGIKLAFSSDLRFCNSLMGMYVRSDLINSARSLFDSLNEKSAVTYSTIIGGYAKHGDYFQVFNLFTEMRLQQIALDAIVFISLISCCSLFGSLCTASSVFSLLIQSGFDCKPSVAAAVVNMYVKCGDINAARKVFDSFMDKDIILWTSMIGGYVQAGLARTAIDLFKDLMSTGLQPNRITIITVLSACADLGSLYFAKQIRGHLNAVGLKSDPQIQTSLIHMYCKCGSVEKAKEIFDSLSYRDLAAWSSMINCYAFHGKGEDAIFLFKEMLKDRSIKPDALVFTDIIAACSHSGLIEEGVKFFISMQQDYGIEANAAHYSCIVDLLSRAGFFESALEFIRIVPLGSSSQLWTPFLSALRSNCSVPYSNTMLKYSLECKDVSTGNHILLAGISSSLGRWKEATDFRILMNKKGMPKEAGWSRTDIFI
ncbi:hypothetical protein HPP92_002070 [Vanilla planifolia]|uniref:Pentatricopeptide repeat-containing protein n=1 Tax=Vanilla planifolia TaxID=51239 RepID=A0A835VM58_VANPL|nr:hypothetical protein HPP92_002070 [Vanilla planifolia]